MTCQVAPMSVPVYGADFYRYSLYQVRMDDGAGRYPETLPIDELPGSDIKICGYLKKLKTMKKKFFVVRSTSSSGAARLEYYDNEKKFRSGHLAKRSIYLHTCFNINKKVDLKHSHAIALYTKDDCFSVILESEEQLENWLQLLLEYQNQYLLSGQKPRIHFENVWQGTIKKKSRGINLDIVGHYRLCLALSEKSVCLVRVHSDEPEYSFQFSSIRRCGHSENVFFMEVGRSSQTGHGELWMQVDDKGTAQSMHTAVLNAMQANKGSFRRRSNTSTSAITAHRNTVAGDEIFNRKRTASESHHPQESPRRQQRSVMEKRPVSSFISPRPPSLTPDSPTPLSSSPINFSPFDQYEERIRSGSTGSRSSYTSSHSHGATDHHGYDSSMPTDNSFISHMSMTPEPQNAIPEEESNYLPMTPTHRSMTPSPTRDVTDNRGMNDSDYLPMTPTHRSTTPSPTRSGVERPGSSGSDSQEAMHQLHEGSGYVDMKPGSSGTNSNSSSHSGYIDMTPGAPAYPEPISGYMKMGSSRPTAPIPIRPPEPGYLDMGPASQPLPTVKEGGSGEAYLPMTPTGQSPISSAGLKPAKVVSYLSDDSMSGEFPKRAYSVGSRPVHKQTYRHQQNLEPQRRQNELDNSRSSSAPHLIVQKSRSLHPRDGAGSSSGHTDTYMVPSPLSQSIKSDDSDSFMEMEFYRPRTASDSYGSRQRTSSFGKQYTQGHRPRSSSYGQQAKNKLSSLVAGSFESVRTTSQELSKRISMDSLGRFSSSSRASSNDSVKRLSEELQQKTNSLNSEYMDMGCESRKTPSPNVHGVISPAQSYTKETCGYVDMTLGTSAPKSQRGVSPSSSSHSLGSSPASHPIFKSDNNKQQQPEVKVVKASGQVLQKPGFKGQSKDNHLQLAGPQGKGLEKRSPSSSGRESEDESYVPFQPAPASSSRMAVAHQHSRSLDSGSRVVDQSSGRSKSPGATMSLASKNSKSDDEGKGDKSSGKQNPKSGKGKSKNKDSKSSRKASAKFLSSENVNQGSDTRVTQTGDSSSSSSSGRVQRGVSVDTADSATRLKVEKGSSEQRNPTGLQDRVTKGRSPTLEKRLHHDYHEVDREQDLFGDIIHLESLDKSPAARVKVKESAYMDYCPASEPTRIPAPSKPLVTSDYEDFNPIESSAVFQEGDGVVSPGAYQGTGPNVSASDEGDMFSYMDFDPVNSPVQHPSQSETVKRPQAVRAFILSDISPSNHNHSNSGVHVRETEVKVQDNGVLLKNRVGAPATEETATLVPSSRVGCDETGTSSQGDGAGTPHGDNDTVSVRETRPSSDEYRDRKSSSTSSASSIGVKDIKFVRPVNRDEDVEDAGYVDIDFSKKAPECPISAERIPTRPRSYAGGIDIIPLPEDIYPEVPKSYICDPEDTSSKETSPSISGSPWKQTSPRYPGSEVKFANLSGDKQSKAVKGETGAGVMCRQTSLALGATQRAVTGGRMRKASGPPGFPSLINRMGTEVGNVGGSGGMNGGRNAQTVEMGSNQELHKQNSMPCMNLPGIEPERSPLQSASLTDSSHSRHSFSDLSGAYEEMTYPPNSSSGGMTMGSKSSSQQQLGDLSSSQSSQSSALNYAQLELGGSSEAVSDSKIKSRHSSSADSSSEGRGNVSYAQIDYEKTESMKNNTPREHRDVKFTL